MMSNENLATKTAIDGFLSQAQKAINFVKELDGTVRNISDGYHTFDELYYHRMVLFSIICNTYDDKAWKS